jgi:hypothetical protein
MKNRIFVAALFVTGMGSVDAAVLRLYMSTAGNDNFHGGSLSQAVRSLNRVQKILQTSRFAGDVEVHIQPGIYYGQRVNWTYFTGRSITFTSLDFSKQRPVFDGLGNEVWFNLDARSGIETRLRFRYLKIQNYNTAITFDGDRNSLAGWNGGNELYGMYFYRIGGLYSHKGRSTGAIIMENSRHNRVENSHFVNIENYGQDASHIHAIYLAHYSSSNAIERNRFAEVNGDPVRTRDASNNNRIMDNDFHRTGMNAFYSDWYCEAWRPDCTKPVPECPSYGNEFRYNDLFSGYYGQIAITKPFGPDAACGPLPERRMQESDNVLH